MRLLKKLKEINKSIYTVADIQKITGYSRSVCYVLLNRLISRDELIRLKNGVYTLPEKLGDIELIANHLYFPSYLSLESALSKYGVISQIPYQLNFVTTLKTKRIEIMNRTLSYHMIKAKYFDYYTRLDNGLFIAIKEKALFDLIYFSSAGKYTFVKSYLNPDKIDMELFVEICKNLLSDRELPGFLSWLER
ncbi:MAG: hypothetical protein DRP88_04415 [Candidatus Neomarinimicrobiota bacterium]|nr:MAG: hypothetical protein DRP88_04415 [Candidatus Neomarinimicrobiota bacterium]